MRSRHCFRRTGEARNNRRVGDELTMMRLRNFVAAAAFLSFPPLPLAAAGWEDTTAAARGKVVYWNAWAGDPRINDYIGWVGGQVRERYGIDLRHVKVTDTADVVSRVLAEKAAGKDQGGSVDLVWINGENFAAHEGKPRCSTAPSWTVCQKPS